MISFDIGLDLFPMLASVLAALTCGLLGNFLVLRRLSLMGDAISHSVLPGLVIAFLITATRSPLVMFVGAATAGVATVVLVELVKKLGRVEPGAAMGVVFSVLFAFGVLLIERAAARHVDLDAECVLHGQLEMLVWYDAPAQLSDLLDWTTFGAVPRQVTTLAIMCAATIAFITLLFKELRIAAFDPELATTQGFNATIMHYVLMIFVAAATVASFEAVGSILVIAMLICPAATARLLTDRLLAQVLCSAGMALAAGILGYLAATAVPAAFDLDSVNAAGSMALAAGALLTLAIVVAPRHGLIVRWARRHALARSVARDDIIAALYRAREAGQSHLKPAQLHQLLPGRAVTRGFRNAMRHGLIARDRDRITLTDAGIAEASELIRKHRVWEHYLVEQAGMAPDHVHPTAEMLEHVRIDPGAGPARDPHGRAIPAGVHRDSKDSDGKPHMNTDERG